MGEKRFQYSTFNTQSSRGGLFSDRITGSTGSWLLILCILYSRQHPPRLRVGNQIQLWNLRNLRIEEETTNAANHANGEHEPCRPVFRPLRLRASAGEPEQRMARITRIKTCTTKGENPRWVLRAQRPGAVGFAPWREECPFQGACPDGSSSDAHNRNDPLAQEDDFSRRHRDTEELPRPPWLCGSVREIKSICGICEICG
jgi:hypothetical protein